MSGKTHKHFTEEILPDWENINYNDPRLNPQFCIRGSQTLLRVSLDRIFYYTGDTVTVQLMVDNTEGKLHCNGVELALMRQIEAEGNSAYDEQKLCKIKELFVIKSKKIDIKCKKTDKNIFKVKFELPSIDDISWMPNNLSSDEEVTLSYFTPTSLGSCVRVKYFILTRMLYSKLSYEESQRVSNEIRIYTKPMFLFSEQPDGKTADDPFEYHGGAKWAKIV